MTPSEWLSRNLTDVIIAVAKANAALAGAVAPSASSPPDTHLQEGSQDD